MTISFEHEHYGEWMGKLILFVAIEMRLPLCSGGSTTLKLALEKVGLEPDRCYWIKHEKYMRDKKKWKALKDPPPDLALEIDISISWLDRLDIYAKLKVPEVWRFDGETLKVLVLGGNGEYKERTKSLAFASLPMDGFVRFVKQLGSDEEVRLTREFRDWLRSEVLARTPNAERTNGLR